MKIMKVNSKDKQLTELAGKIRGWEKEMEKIEYLKGSWILTRVIGCGSRDKE